MSDPLALIVLVAAGDAHAAEAASLARSATSAAGARVEVTSLAAEPTEDEALRAAERARAEAVAVVTFSAEGARLRVHHASPARWLDRVVWFQGSDQPAERGRTIGFALASMLPDPASTPPESAPPPPRPPDPPVAEWAPLPDELPRPTPRTPSFRGSVDASALGTVAIGGPGGGVGAVLSARWYAWRRLGFRAGIGVRAGQVAAAQATALDVTGAVGAVVSLVEARPAQPLAVGVRAEALLVRQALSRYATGDIASEAARLVPGAGALVEAAIHFVPGGAVVVAAGPEVLFGDTTVYVGDRLAATLSPWRLSLELGLRARF